MSDAPKPPRKRSRPKTVPEASSPAALQRMKSQRQKDTAAELALRKALDALGLVYEVQQRILPGVRRSADVVFPEARVAVFIDGCFWHACPLHATWPKANAAWWREKIEANQRRDANTDATLQAAGWYVERVWEHEDPVEAASRIASVVARDESR